jgi:dTDP-4-dehydrorhamnose reductase
VALVRGPAWDGRIADVSEAQFATGNFFSGPIAVTGSSGFLGRRIMARLSGLNATGIVRKQIGEDSRCVEADLSDSAAVARAFGSIQPKLILHLAAMTDVDECERNPARAYRDNILATANIASWVAAHAPQALLVYISSDQVYSGLGPHDEMSPSPMNTYALTKLGGEHLCRAVARSLILRTNFYATPSYDTEGFAGWLVSNLSRGAAITLFDDVCFNPLYSEHLIDALFDTVSLGLTGTFNLGASGPGLSKAEFATELAQIFGLPVANAKVGRVADVSLVARRPRDMRISVGALEDRLRRSLPTVSEGLESLFRDWPTDPTRSALG